VIHVTKFNLTITRLGRGGIRVKVTKLSRTLLSTSDFIMSRLYWQCLHYVYKGSTSNDRYIQSLRMRVSMTIAICHHNMGVDENCIFF